MLNRIYIVVGGLLVGGFGLLSFTGTEFGTTRYALPIAGQAIVRSHGWSSGYHSSSNSRSGWGVFGGK